MQRSVVLSLAIAILAFQPGCATYVAIKMPGPANDEAIQPGMQRAKLESVLKTGPASEFTKGDVTTVRYEYADGPHQAWKVRALIYVAGDVFLVFLSEIIFWPIELIAEEQIQRVGLAEYDAAFALREWQVTRKAGKVLEASYLGNDGNVVKVVERDDKSKVAEAKILAWQQQKQREAAAQASAPAEADEGLPPVALPPAVMAR